MSEELDSLKTLFPVWKIKNKKSVSAYLPLFNGDSILFPPNATKSIESANIHQLPSMSTFSFIQPTINDMIAIGLIKKTTTTSSSTSANTTE